MRRLFVGAGLTFALTFMASAAYADNFGSIPSGGSPPSGVSLANNKGHTVDYFNVESRQVSLTNWALNNQFPRLEFTTAVVNSDSYDVRVYDDNYGDNGVIGWVECPTSATTGNGTNYPNLWCYGQRLRFNLTDLYAFTWDTSHGGGFIACHELGHTVGLRHEFDTSEDGCMQRPPTPDGADSNTYSPEDVSHVRGAY